MGLLLIALKYTTAYLFWAICTVFVTTTFESEDKQDCLSQSVNSKHMDHSKRDDSKRVYLQTDNPKVGAGVVVKKAGVTCVSVMAWLPTCALVCDRLSASPHPQIHVLKL